MAGDYSDLDQFPETWELKRIGDFASVKGGKRLPAGTALVPTRTNHPYLRIVDFKDRGIDKSGLMFVPDDVFPQIARYIISSRDIYVSIVGTIGLVGVVDKSLDGANLTENAAKICNIADEVDRDYLAAFLGSGWGQHQIGALTVGSTQPKLALFRIGDIRVPLPPLAEQKAIAAVLGALDDKIELNRRMNATLEAMARALFQSWFVDFDPVRLRLSYDGQVRPTKENPTGLPAEALAKVGLDPATAALFPDSFDYTEREVLPTGWTYPALPDVTTFKEGPGILAKDFHDVGVPLIRLAGLDNGVSLLAGCNFLDPEKVEQKWSHFRLELGDVLLSTSASLGRVAEVGEEAVGAIPYTGLIAFRARAHRSNQRYIRHYLTSSHFQQQVEAMGVGSVLRHFGPTHLKSMSVLEPPLAIQRAFSDLVGPLDQKVARNLRESHTLATLRDTLLPKLLSGELSVAGIESKREAIR
jgi:type I restriction enzyme S subunit